VPRVAEWIGQTDTHQAADAVARVLCAQGRGEPDDPLS